MALVKCSECQKEISDQAKSCVHCGCIVKVKCKECGAPMDGTRCNSCGYVSAASVPTDKQSNQALTGMILGLVSIIAWLIPLFGYPCTIVGLVFSSKGLNSKNRGMAIAGLTLSIIFLVLTVLNSIAGVILNSVV